MQVKRVLAWFAGLVGIAALGRYLAGRSKSRAASEAPTLQPSVDAVAESGDDPAAELRRKLADARASTEPEPNVEEADAPLDDRRAQVHAQARETIDAMAQDGPS